jgi:hypothetical protein
MNTKMLSEVIRTLGEVAERATAEARRAEAEAQNNRLLRRPLNARLEAAAARQARALANQIAEFLYNS